MPPQTFLFEIGTEELPADFVRSAITQWQGSIPASLTAEFLQPESVEIYGTPRRLAVLIKGLPAQQPDRLEEIKGPPASAAFKDGQLTPAALGFAKKQGVSPEDFEVRSTPKGDFIFVNKQLRGQASRDLLPSLALTWLKTLDGRRFMRWGDGDWRFPRPIRWLVCLLDDQVLPLQIDNGSTTLVGDRLSRGHRILHPEPVSLDHGENYLAQLKQAGVVVDPEERRAIILEQIASQAAAIAGEAIIYDDLLDEVEQLVEYPTAVLGTFDQEFLSLPREVITTVMVTHQRYFPVVDNNGQLLPHFITIANGDPSKGEIIATGNGRVIRARLADAKFFYQADCDDSLDSYLPQLETVTFQEELGTMRDKVDRIMEMAAAIADQLGATEQQRGEIDSTAMLCKADLVTQMVYEFPELQGIMGEKYALVSGESAAVAQGIVEHYLPRHQDDDLPQGLPGQVVGMADRLDTLVSIFGLGLLPTGSSDPFALRRAANAVINVAWAAGLDIDLLALLTQGCQDFVTSHPDKESPLEALKTFFLQRLQTLLQDEQGIDYDLVNAVLGNGETNYGARLLTDLQDGKERAQYLQELRDNGHLEAIYPTVNRSTKLASKGTLPTDQLDPRPVIDAPQLVQNSEKAVYQALLAIYPKAVEVQQSRDYETLVNALHELAPTVADFFDGPDSVLVMAENNELRQNRLNLLGLIRNYALILGDFGAIVKGI
ncbi:MULTISPECIES: glycine--tRNA ligase subunit beta [unclassified Synechocystis]|uniref:glycine--tRNA ligase subunit beta n=1 Tax=unclassified Synechocystis TaxID=2640012 RepID=UPI000406C20C|nr:MULTISPECIES: glycine--tRNA ligase subunit beta [unclassified Synechocystis]AIE73057.1 Glycyl-tRNA synthetase beta chain [Synechocystis sp. PCC 6714]MCT0254410.1 glycine--tRNA ligase subunit beta [Synechocystis sp. CS-94]